ncbi:DUF742 domain-containing protein [Saccharothrix sp. Mg75]|uniref:DUF742 domain-containing protein n=1 Tax=Saccharothrix sp. Mg75 TaxID=3445357 RepID=UPI003EEEBF33
MNKRHKSRPAAASFHPLAFGGWQDYETWAANDFRPKPADRPPVVEEPPAPVSEVREPPAPPPAVVTVPSLPAVVEGPTEYLAPGHLAPGEPAEVRAPAARPYVRTRGRTRAAHDLRLETIVSALPGTPPPADATAHRLHRMCRAPLSVAEVAVHLGVPLGVARVLISDAITDGLVVAHEDRTPAAGGPSLELLNRVHAGLLRLQ